MKCHQSSLVHIWTNAVQIPGCVLVWIIFSRMYSVEMILCENVVMLMQTKPIRKCPPVLSVFFFTSTKLYNLYIFILCVCKYIYCKSYSYRVHGPFWSCRWWMFFGSFLQRCGQQCWASFILPPLCGSDFTTNKVYLMWIDVHKSWFYRLILQQTTFLLYLKTMKKKKQDENE